MQRGPARGLPRRGILAFAASFAVAGCGFHPLYAPAADGESSPAVQQLAEITVARIPDRPGQLLRQALIERFERAGVAVAHRYDLEVILAYGEEGIAIQPDTSTTYQRVVANAVWTLRAQDPNRTVLASGRARAIDGYNWINEQFFEAALEDELVHRRLAEQIADQITWQLAAYFTKHKATA